ncbi:MAG TPA: hypothetical protein VKH19_15445 [Gemmatimonadaceae bacterium]|nr:hypothetical protein [Gemmatimonadaceae bacterium]
MTTISAFSARALGACLLATALACAGTTTSSSPSPSSDPRVGLRAGKTDAAEAVFGTRQQSNVPPPAGFTESMNSDLAFLGNYAIQGNFAGPQIWDVSDRNNPKLVTTIACPASQNDVSVYGRLLFLSVESNNSTLDCKQMTLDTVDTRRMRGVRIFDISDIRNPKLVTNVQTCRGSHTHTLVEDPRDRDNVYLYVSGSSTPRSPRELAGCTSTDPDSSTQTSLWRVEIIKVPLANPAAAAVVNRANIFAGLRAPAEHGETAVDSVANKLEADSARAAGGFVAKYPNSNQDLVIPSRYVAGLLDSIVKSRNGTGSPTAADSAALRAGMQNIINTIFGAGGPAPTPGVSPISRFSQCHDITVYPSLGLAGGACEGHGLLLDIRDPVNPKRLDAVADSNFAYWHSATFNNDGTKILFSDEWGGGGAPKCRATDPKDWGADAIFEIVNGKMEFRSYYKLPAAQTNLENCVAHNGSLVPVPGRDIMVQGWYQGGISVFDFTDARHPMEIAYQDRGPLDPTRFTMGGSWSAYWYNGGIVSSEIARGLDAMELVPTQYLTQNEIDAAKTVRMTYFNAQGQPKMSWPPTFALARAYLDQLERNKCMPASRISATRTALATAESAAAGQRTAALTTIIDQLEGDKRGSCDANRIDKVQKALQGIAHPVVP